VKPAADLYAITAAHSKKRFFLQTSCSNDRDSGFVQRCSGFYFCKLSMRCLEEECGDISSLVALSVLSKPAENKISSHCCHSQHLASTQFTNKQLY
jgi:hypothetical protein